MVRKNNFDFISIMIERGFLHQVTEKENLQKEMLKNRVAHYFHLVAYKKAFHERMAISYCSKARWPFVEV